MLLGNPRIELADWKDALRKGTVPADLDAFVNHIQADYLPHSVIDRLHFERGDRDPISGMARARHPRRHAQQKGQFRQTWQSTRRLRELGRKLNTHYLYEATVGAGLPVITTLRDLVQTGDQVLQIDGVLSGTLSFLFNSFTGERPFSEIVREAKQKGYTEPDPRDDLSGRDVARKLIILAREMGLPLELEQVEVQSLVPPELAQAATADEFMAALPRFDAQMEQLRLEAAKAGECLRYVGVVRPGGRTTVSLQRYPLTHSFSRIAGSDNIIAFRTERYSGQPLIVQGPGAGPEVTAGGIFADLLRLTSYLGAAT